MTLLASREAPAQVTTTQSHARLPEDLELRAGDVILIDLGCYVCRIISTTTGSPYNHSGLVLGVTASGGVLIAQSLTKTEVVSIDKFLSQAKPKSSASVRRTRELDQLFLADPKSFQARIGNMQSRFEESFKGRPFDDEFLWNNSDTDGGEILYCSEMVQKTLNHALESELPTITMDYSSNWDFWSQYFKGEVPHGLQGNSPSSLAQAQELQTVWEGRL